MAGIYDAGPEVRTQDKIAPVRDVIMAGRMNKTVVTDQSKEVLLFAFRHCEKLG